MNLFQIVSFSGIIQSSLFVIAFCVNVRPIFNKVFNHFQIILFDGIMQSGSTKKTFYFVVMSSINYTTAMQTRTTVFCVDVCAAFNKEFNHFHIAMGDR